MTFDRHNSLGLYILNDEGEPVPENDTLKWGRWLEANYGKRHIMKSHIEGWYVSTIFLAIDHGFGMSGPILWETMVFAPNPEGDHGLDWAGEKQWRYRTRKEAEDGHARAVEILEGELARAGRATREVFAALKERMK